MIQAPETTELFRMFQDHYAGNEKVIRVEWHGDSVKVTTIPSVRYAVNLDWSGSYETTVSP